VQTLNETKSKKLNCRSFVSSLSSESIGLKQLIALFVGRTYSEWKDPEVPESHSPILTLKTTHQTKRLFVLVGC
jgi:hypothetical protein